jgi:uncharacterized Zn-binding protein involved in type VI secretion
MKPAARVGDNHVCTTPTPVAHVGGPVQPPCSVNMLTDGRPQARASDRLTCAVPPPNFIVTGSGSCLIDGLPAARMTDKTMHPPSGSIVMGSTKLLIGGPTVGVTLGNPAAGEAACNQAAGGRAGGSSQQSYQNCGVESARQIINQATGANVGEDALMDHAMNNHMASRESTRADSGGTSPAERTQLLNDQGVSTSSQPQTMANVMQGVAEGRGVITSHDVSVLWGPGNTGGHAIVVTGIRYGADGRPEAVITNDTGRLPGDGNCRVEYSAATFENSFRPGRDINVTNNPIW